MIQDNILCLKEFNLIFFWIIW